MVPGQGGLKAFYMKGLEKQAKHEDSLLGHKLDLEGRWLPRMTTRLPSGVTAAEKADRMRRRRAKALSSVPARGS